MVQRVRMQIIIEEVEDAAGGAGVEGEIRETAEGIFEQVISDESAESIDEMAAVLHRMQYEVSRRTLARQLSGVAKKKPVPPPPPSSAC